MEKPTYYLWKNDFDTEEKWLKAKETFEGYGFRVVLLADGKKEGLKDIFLSLLGSARSDPPEWMIEW